MKSERKALIQFRTDNNHNSYDGNKSNDNEEKIIMFPEIIEMLDRIRYYFVIDDKSQFMQPSITKNVRLLNCKQKTNCN